jgi:acetate kinase
MKILVINSGSSSIKYRLYEMPQEELLLKGSLDCIGEKGSQVRDHYEGLKIILKKIPSVDVIGHRVVHGGEEFTKPTIISEYVMDRINAYSALAPLHNPPNLMGIRACKELLKGIKQVAVFDTAFHQTLPPQAYMYGLPYDFYKKYKIRKYGFHGTSHQYVAEQAASILKKPLRELNLITCHLGNGCSMSAVRRGKCVDTTMGFTPLEGLLMGTRAGDIDAAVVIYLENKLKLSPNAVDRILNKESGIKGVSGISNDMRKINSYAAKGNLRAKLAREIFIYRIRKYLGAYAVVLKTINAVIFTAGIGENQKDIRRDVMKGLFDCFKHKPRILVIPTNEELMIARQAYSIIAKH